MEFRESAGSLLPRKTSSNSACSCWMSRTCRWPRAVLDTLDLADVRGTKRWQGTAPSRKSHWVWRCMWTLMSFPLNSVRQKRRLWGPRLGWAVHLRMTTRRKVLRKLYCEQQFPDTHDYQNHWEPNQSQAVGQGKDSSVRAVLSMCQAWVQAPKLQSSWGISRCAASEASSTTGPDIHTWTNDWVS